MLRIASTCACGPSEGRQYRLLARLPGHQVRGCHRERRSASERSCTRLPLRASVAHRWSPLRLSSLRPPLTAYGVQFMKEDVDTERVVGRAPDHHASALYSWDFTDQEQAEIQGLVSEASHTFLKAFRGSSSSPHQDDKLGRCKSARMT